MPDNPLVSTLYVIIMAGVLSAFISYMYAGMYTFLRPLIQKMSSRGKSTVIQLCAIASPIVTLVSVIVFFFPSVFSLPTFYGHCHLEQCEPHVPEFFQSGSTIFSIILFSLIFALIVCALIIRDQMKLAMKINCLIDLISDSSATKCDKAIELVDSPIPLLLNVGLFAPRIVISKSLLKNISDKEFQVIMVYELIRCKRYENLRRIISKVGTWLWPRFAKKLLLDDLSATAHEIARADTVKTSNIGTWLPCSSHAKSALLPTYIKTLLKAMLPTQVFPVQTEIPNNPGFTNKIGLTVFSVQYFALMVLVTSIMHFLSERFL